MKKQELNNKMTETMTTKTNTTMKKAESTNTNATEKKTFADWLIQTLGASAIAGISAMSGSSDGGDVYQNRRVPRLTNWIRRG